MPCGDDGANCTNIWGRVIEARRCDNQTNQTSLRDKNHNIDPILCAPRGSTYALAFVNNANRTATLSCGTSCIQVLLDGTPPAASGYSVRQNPQYLHSIRMGWLHL